MQEVPKEVPKIEIEYYQRTVKVQPRMGHKFRGGGMIFPGLIGGHYDDDAQYGGQYSDETVQPARSSYLETSGTQYSNVTQIGSSNVSSSSSSSSSSI